MAGLRSVVIANYHSLIKLIERLRGIIRYAAADRRPLKRAVVARQNRLREIKYGFGLTQRQLVCKSVTQLFELTLDVTHQPPEVLAIDLRKNFFQATIAGAAC